MLPTELLQNEKLNFHTHKKNVTDFYLRYKKQFIQGHAIKSLIKTSL